MEKVKKLLVLLALVLWLSSCGFLKPQRVPDDPCIRAHQLGRAKLGG